MAITSCYLKNRDRSEANNNATSIPKTTLILRRRDRRKNSFKFFTDYKYTSLNILVSVITVLLIFD